MGKGGKEKLERPCRQPSPDSIVRDLHAIREQIVDEYGGDLVKLTEAARRRQELSGHTIIRKGEVSDPTLPGTGDDSVGDG